MEYYVYTYLDENKKPYYVGMGKGRRYKVPHLYVDVPDQSHILIEDKLTQQQAWDLEIKLIAEHGRISNGTGILENLTDGGESGASGWNQSRQAKRKISEGNKGKKRTAAQRKNYCGPKSAEHANNIRLANIGRPNDGRYVKIGLTKSKQRWFTNGVITRMCVPGTEPAGFLAGRKIKEIV